MPLLSQLCVLGGGSHRLAGGAITLLMAPSLALALSWGGAGAT